MRLVFIFLAAIGLCGAVYAGDDMAAMHLHSLNPDYDSITGGSDDFTRPLEAVAIKFESPLEMTGAYKNGKAVMVKMSAAEVHRVEGLRRKFIEMYIKSYTGCRIDPKARWELVIACDPNTGLTDGGNQIADLPTDDGINLNGHKLTYPVVHGWYCLVDRKKKTVAFDRDFTGTGSAIDIALDDFCRKLILDFADTIKEK